MKFYTQEELAELSFEELVRLAEKWEVPYMGARALLETRILELQHDYLVKLRDAKEHSSIAWERMVLEIEDLKRELRGVKKEITALKGWLSELDDEAIRVSLVATGVISFRDLVSYSYLALMRIATSLGLEPDGTEPKNRLVTAIRKELKLRGFAQRVLQESTLLDPERRKEAISQVVEGRSGSSNVRK